MVQLLYNILTDSVNQHINNPFFSVKEYYHALSFFRALNPTSHFSGITYALAKDNPCQGTEMIDRTFVEWYALNYDDSSRARAIFNLLMGEHYDLFLMGRNNSIGGAKGILDFLIFPLIARKLIADFFLPERNKSPFLNILALAIAIPLEVARFSVAVALTLLIAPVVLFIDFLKSIKTQNNFASARPMQP